MSCLGIKRGPAHLARWLWIAWAEDMNSEYVTHRCLSEPSWPLDLRMHLAQVLTLHISASALTCVRGVG